MRHNTATLDADNLQVLLTRFASMAWKTASKCLDLG